MKKSVLFLIFAAFVQPAMARPEMSIEDYYEMVGSGFTPEQKVMASQNIKLVHILDAFLPESPGNTEFLSGVNPDGEQCEISRNRSNMFLSNSGKIGDTPYAFNWDPNELGSNVKGEPIVGDFKISHKTVEATAKVAWRSIIPGVPARIGLKLELLDNDRVSISIRNTANALFDQYQTCIIQK